MNEEQVREYGRELGTRLGAGDVVALTGELGAGKTTLAKAIAGGLGVTDLVTSPSFTLVSEYMSGRLPFNHIDVYRLGSPDDDLRADELSEIGIDEYLFGAGVTVVEWADRIEGLLPEHAVRIELSYTNDPDIRKVEIKQDIGVNKETGTKPRSGQRGSEATKPLSQTLPFENGNEK